MEIVAVTKKFPASDVSALAELGITHVGENRHQEGAAKRIAVPNASLTWHFVGQLQTNKARVVTGFADQVDTVDRLALVAALERGAAFHGRIIDCLVQVSLDPNPDTSMHRGGCLPDDALAIAAAIDTSEHLRLRGVMGMAPLDQNPPEAFALLARVADQIRAAHPNATDISAGMSGDFPAAIAAGATHVRLGTAILGERPQVG